MGTRALTRSLSIPAALLLCLALGGQSMAAGTWATPTRVADYAWSEGLATLADGTALIAYEKCIGRDFCSSRTYVKRSTDGGVTWEPRYEVPDDADMAAIDGRGSTVDLVYRSIGGGLGYRRSTDGGVSFGPEMNLGHSYGSAQEPSVARGPNGLVAVSWGEWPNFTDLISVRVSDDGGATFGAKTSWHTSDTDWSAVAVGNGVVYVLHLNGQGSPVVRRSNDRGETWTKILPLPDISAPYYASIAAAGNNVFVTYVGGDDYEDVLVQRSSDKGSAWSQPDSVVSNLSAPYEPKVTIDGGVMRMIYTTDDGLYYTESHDGQSWSDPDFVTRRKWGGYVGFAGRPIVVYEGRQDIFVRTRTP